MAYNCLPNPYTLHTELETLANSKIAIEQHFAQLLSACLNLEAEERPKIRNLRWAGVSLQ